MQLTKSWSLIIADFLINIAAAMFGAAFLTPGFLDLASDDGKTTLLAFIVLSILCLAVANLLRNNDKFPTT